MITLREIETDAQREAALAIQRAPGQERFVSSVEESFRDAVVDARARPRFWTINAGDEVVGFVMISDGISAAQLADDPTLIGPYYLWRLLIDRRHQRRGYGGATLDAVVAYLRGRPGADVLWTSCGQGPGTPQPFYEAYGFRPTGQMLDDEAILRLDLTTHDR